MTTDPTQADGRAHPHLKPLYSKNYSPYLLGTKQWWGWILVWSTAKDVGDGGVSSMRITSSVHVFAPRKTPCFAEFPIAFE